MLTRHQRGLRATIVSLSANALLAGVKLCAGLVGHSHALVAYAVESFADLLSSLVVWRGLVLAAKPADADHPYGHGKAEPIAAATVATMLLLAAAGIAVKSLQEVFAPHRGPAAFTLVVLLAVVAIKEGLFRFIYRESTVVASRAMSCDAWHHRCDAITSLAAFVGIAIALIGGSRYAAADDVAAIVAAGIIAWNGWRLLRPALDELMDTLPDPELIRRIQHLAGTVPEVEAVEKCLVRKMGYQLFVDMHIEVDPQMSVRNAHAVANSVKDAVRAGFPAVSDVLVHVEPAADPRAAARPRG